MTVRGTGRPSGYRLADGAKIPSVTTVLGRFKDSGGLVYKAKENWHEAGRRGLPFERDAYWGSPVNWGVDAKEAGSIAHGWIEDYLHGDDNTRVPNGADLAACELAVVGYQAFKDWARLVSLEVIETETPLVSEVHRFGGTLDCVARISGTLAILDWKTSNKVYGEYISQVAAYRQLLRERDGEAAPDLAFLLRVGKTHADFAFYSWPAAVLDLGWRFFLAARELYDADAVLKKVA